MIRNNTLDIAIVNRAISYLAALLLGLAVCKAVAQEPGLPDGERFGPQRLPPLDFQATPPAPLELPPVAPPPKEQLSAQVRVWVRRFKLTGNTVFSDQDLAKVTAPYEGRVITSEELQEVRRRLTEYYVDRHYINSGVVIPDQRVVDGVIELVIVEGRLTEVALTGNERLRSRYITDRLVRDPRAVLSVRDLQERLQLLQQSPLIGQVRAELAPGLKPGEGILNVQVREANPYQVGLSIANDHSPSVGAEWVELYAAHRNLTGWGDALGVQYGHSLTNDADDIYAFYAYPLNARDTTLRLWFENGDSDVVEEPFEELDITSELETYAVYLTHPVYRTPQRSLVAGVGLERRHSETFLLGEPFSFSPGVQDGESDVTVIRLSQDWLDRGVNQVIAARSVFSVGIDAFGATSGAEPDGEFFAWLGQFQWAGRFGARGYQAIFRTDLQVAADSLLPLEQCAVGGASTVRGYRENQLVRDNCWITSLEFRVPVVQLRVPKLSRGPGDGWVQLAPFADFGWGWNTDLETPDPETISSAGLGIRWDPGPQLHAELYWGHAFRNFDVEDHDLQDSGIHFRVEFLSSP